MSVKVNKKKKVVQIAFYKGPPQHDLMHTISHYGIRIFTLSKYSHAELVIDGVCYSSSARDGGVRSKTIDLNSGRWDVITINADAEYALRWFTANIGKKYDWRGIFRFAFPVIGHNRDQYVCFESVGEMLGLAGAHRLTANDLYRWALQNRAADPV